jgi:hypothetical protein
MRLEAIPKRLQEFQAFLGAKREMSILGLVMAGNLGSALGTGKVSVGEA